jgi:hypothetical protein
MTIKRHHRQWQVSLLGHLPSRLNHMLMPAMHPIEKA